MSVSEESGGEKKYRDYFYILSSFGGKGGGGRDICTRGDMTGRAWFKECLSVRRRARGGGRGIRSC